MESINNLYCPNCKKRYTKVYMFPCLHSLCEKCTNFMKIGSARTCLMCSKSCHQDELKRNAFIEKICLLESQHHKRTIEVNICEICNSDESENQAEKYCVDCSQYICLKCSIVHVKSKVREDHNIVDKKNVENSTLKLPEPYCQEHKRSLTIFCKSCDLIICINCSVMNHFDHEKSDKLKEVFAKSSSNIKNTISELDKIIENQDILIKQNKKLENDCVKNCDKVRNDLESFRKELKDEIDKLINTNVDQINTIKNNYIKSIRDNIKGTTNYISLIKNVKSDFQQVIKNGSNFDVFNLMKDKSKTKLIERMKPKLLPLIMISFEKPSVDTLILPDILNSIRFCAKRDLNIYKVKNFISSACVFQHCIYIVNDNNKCVDIYDNATNNYQTSIDIKQYSRTSNAAIVSTKKAVFLYYYDNTNSDTYTHILQLKEDRKAFVEFNRLQSHWSILSNNQHTLLLRKSNMIVELSVKGEEIFRMIIPPAAILPEPKSFNIAHQLKNGHFFVTSNNRNHLLVSLLDHQGFFIKSVTLNLNSRISCCTDDEKYVFLLESSSNKITVLSTDLKCLHEFSYPGAMNIYYDHVKGRVILLKQCHEIISFKFNYDLLQAVA